MLAFRYRCRVLTDCVLTHPNLFLIDGCLVFGFHGRNLLTGLSTGVAYFSYC